MGGRRPLSWVEGPVGCKVLGLAAAGPHARPAQKAPKSGAGQTLEDVVYPRVHHHAIRACPSVLSPGLAITTHAGGNPRGPGPLVVLDQQV